MLGVSLAPQMLLPQAEPPRLLTECGGTDGLLRFLRGLGVTHVELRGAVLESAAHLLQCARIVWQAGLQLTLHWALPAQEAPFDEACAALVPLLEEAKRHQPYVMLTVHSYSTGNDAEKAPAALRTNRLLRCWEADAQRYGFRLALEINRDKKNGDPSVTCEGVLAMLEGTDDGITGICFDFGHFYSNTRDEAILPAEAFLKRVIHTHIPALENGTTHFPVTATAQLPLDAYVQALIQAGYDGIYDLELDFTRYPDRAPRFALRESAVALKGALYRARGRTVNGADLVLQAQREAYPAALRAITQALETQTGDRFYQFCASGQIFSVGGQRFAVDPAIREERARNASIGEVRELLAQIPVVFITHEHDDHFNFSMLRQMTDLDCIWVIGDSLTKKWLEASCLRPEKILLVRPGDAFEVCGIGVEVFEGSHYDPDGSGTGVPAVMYLLTVGGKRIFIPADLRDYGADRLPVIAPPDVMFANVWLGRAGAIGTADGAFEEFCDYVAYYRPAKVFLGHMWEAMRTPQDMWRWEHAGRIMDGLAKRMPAVQVTPLQMFNRYEL
ncbi:MAG: MBL fold metallo-hydrolase [Oscillospiraceae bacterium]|nr:MBL fold metallo-hydrolase [Oscillospiraceae bacterium]